MLALSGGYDLSDELYSLVVIFAISASLPIILGLLRLPVAEVVFLLGAGIVFGPSVLGWIQLSEAITLLAEIGMAFLFFAAGLELEKHAIRGRSGRLAGIGWLTSVVIACLVAGLLQWLGIIRDFLGVAIALTSTALGTLLPILRDKGLLKTPFGSYFMGAGAIGEFGPILAISILLSAANPAMGIVAVGLFATAALVFAKVPGWLRSDRVVSIIDRGHGTSSQTAIRLTLLLILGLVATAEFFGLDVALGAFVAGVILKLFASDSEGTLLESKLIGVAFGVFIPVFFIVSGAKLDIQSIIEHPLLLILFTVALLIVRGVPQFFIYRRAIPQAGQRAQFSLYVATALPIIVAVTSIETENGIMKPAVAAALVGAGALSVLIFPLVGQFLGGRGQPERSEAIA